MATDSPQPVMFISHGGGPCFYLDGKEMPMFKEMDKNSRCAGFLRNLAKQHVPNKPKAILVVSSHWEEKSCKVTTHANPPLYFDYYGFPEQTYKLTWPVPGAPEVARHTQELLEKSGIKCGEDEKRGLDHGVFVPLKLSFPEADIPVFQLSLLEGLDIAMHIRIGEALSGLPNEGVLIIASGSATHNMRPPESVSWLEEFKLWLEDILTNSSYSPQERKAKLLDSKTAKHFRTAHPREEHFIPVIVAAAAAKKFKAAEKNYEETVMKAFLLDSYKF